MEIKKEVRYFLIMLLVIMILALVAIYVAYKSGKISVCNDGTFYDGCSLAKPYYCNNGTLIEKASICGCSNLTTKSEEICISKYQTNPKNIFLDYVLRGERGEISFVVYGGLYDYLSNVPRSIYYSGNETPSRADFKLKNMNEKEQRELLIPLVVKIQEITEDKKDQVRIAISMVQNIDYGFSNKTDSFIGKEINYSRYNYEVLYDGQGICGEKTTLLAFLLREMGYKASLFYYAEENHEALGIGCPFSKSFGRTGYCFVETTGPAILSDESIEYVGGITLDSEPEIMILSEGGSLGISLYEYKDARIIRRLRQGKFVLSRDLKLKELQTKYGLIEEYYVA
ncbi:MAG TPA: hypothetical protein VMV95_03140 [Bacillota bacterium]|nr:hypothetical protein [Bacillota bacterium]